MPGPPLNAAVYGACHAEALEVVLAAHPQLRGRVRFTPLDPCMSITDAAMDAFVADTLPTLDLFIHQPISRDSRGEAFASARILERLRPHTLPISFPYFHFELYTPFITAPDRRLPTPPFDYVDYLLATLIARGLGDAEAARQLLHLEGLEPHAPMIRGSAFYELGSREERVLPGDRPLDVRITERVQETFEHERLCHTNNHPGATVMGWIGDAVAERIAVAFALPAAGSERGPRPDPLDGIDYFTAPFVKRTVGLTFDDAPMTRIDGRTLDLARYVAHHRPYYETIPPAVLRTVFEATLPPRPWYAVLLDLL